MDDDLSLLTRDGLRAEVIRLRAGIRAHLDGTRRELRRHRPKLWGLLQEPIAEDIKVPAWPQFLHGCLKYRDRFREPANAPHHD